MEASAIAELQLGTKLFYCGECSASFTRNTQLAVHILSVHPDPEELPEDGVKQELDSEVRSDMFPCDSCEEIFSSEILLYVHRRVDHSDSPANLSDASLENNNNSYFYRVRNKERPHQCPICELTYRHRSSLKRHVATCHPEVSEEYRNDVEQILVSPPIARTPNVTVTSHQVPPNVTVGTHQLPPNVTVGTHQVPPEAPSLAVQSTTRKRYSCQFCDKTFQYRSSRIYHERHLHNDKQQFRCKLCGEKFQLKGHLHMHMLYHTGPLQHKCEFCAATFQRRSHLNEHLTTHTGERRFHCDECGKSFARSCILTVHKRKHAKTQNAKKKVNVGLRELFLTKQMDMDKLLNDVIEESATRCDRNNNPSMDSTTKLDSVLDTVMKAAMSTPSSDIAQRTCEECGSIEKSLVAKRQHMWHYHQTGSFVCSVPSCNEAFNDRISYVCHGISEHNGTAAKKEIDRLPSGRVRCPLCNKTFFDFNGMTVHLRCHTGEKPFRCKICQRSFSQTGALNRHMRLLHSQNVKTLAAFPCPECKEMFFSATGLTLHSRRCPCRPDMAVSARRVRSKPPDPVALHACEFCGVRFRNPASLRLHETAVHNGSTTAFSKQVERTANRLARVRRTVQLLRDDDVFHAADFLESSSNDATSLPSENVKTESDDVEILTVLSVNTGKTA